MLTAKKSLWFEKLFAVYNRNLFKRRFHSLKVCGLDFLSDRDAQAPLLIYANHSSWWDGLAAFEISRAAKLDSFIMMEEKQLKKLFLFRRLGAFSVVREDKRQAVKSLNYAVDLLKENPQRALWVFPQGEILPGDARPLKFYNGVARIVEKSKKCRVVALAIRYEFLSRFKPEIFVKISVPRLMTIDDGFDSKSVTKEFEANLTKLLDELKLDVSNSNFADYKEIF